MNDKSFSAVVLFVACVNLIYFFVEFFCATKMDSVSLFADSIDFLEDASINILIYFAVGWTLAARARMSMLLAACLLIPCTAALWSVWQQVMGQHPPAAAGMSLVGLGALIVNATCALLLAKFRKGSGSLSSAAFLSARNDALANIAIIATGFVTMVYPSIWPDILVGLGIAAMNADAAYEVYQSAKKEYNDAAA